MRNNETGEFELVMGNRQLLSGFFIVALLFGVAFAMGYIVGRSSSPSAKAQAEASQSPVVEQRPAASGARLTEASGAESPKTEAAASAPASTAAHGAIATAVGKAAETSAEPASPQLGLAEPDPGSYWQVAAVRQSVAEVVVRTLKDKGFAATMSPGPNNLIRVLVGPYNDRESLGKAKADLENAGFHPYLKK
jgi:cell division septation protein DedD